MLTTPTLLTLVRHSLTASSLLVAFAAAGCTDSVTEPDPDSDPVDPNDTTPPTVASTEPAAGGIGVRADAKIHITFSEPMDTISVEAAFSSTDLAAASFGWGAGGRVLTITPAEPFAYGEGLGADPDAIERLTYSLSIGTGATDLAGNPLAAPLDLTFSTKRRLLAAFPYDADMTRVVRQADTLLAVNNPLWIGDNNTQEAYRSYLTFDLSTLPEGSEIEAAEFSGRQLQPTNLPYSMGSIKAQHVTFSTMTGVSSVQAMSLPGVFSADATLTTRRLLVTSQVKDDVDNRIARGNRSQFRLQFDTPHNNNNVTDMAVFDKTTFQLLALFIVD
jgi:hypothetical protein